MSSYKQVCSDYNQGQALNGLLMIADMILSLIFGYWIHTQTKYEFDILHFAKLINK